MNILLVGHQSDSEIGHHVIEILHQLSLIDDSTLTSVLPQLEFKLKVFYIHLAVYQSTCIFFLNSLLYISVEVLRVCHY